MTKPLQHKTLLRLPRKSRHVNRSNTMNKLHEHAETTAIGKKASPRAGNSPCQQKQHHMIKPHEHDETTADPNACTRTMFPGLCSAKLHCTCTHACIAPLHPVGRWAGKQACRQASRQAGRQADREADRKTEADKQAGRGRADRQTSRQTGRQRQTGKQSKQAKRNSQRDDRSEPMQQPLRCDKTKHKTEMLPLPPHTPKHQHAFSVRSKKWPMFWARNRAEK